MFTVIDKENDENVSIDDDMCSARAVVMGHEDTERFMSETTEDLQCTLSFTYGYR